MWVTRRTVIASSSAVLLAAAAAQAASQNLLPNAVQPGTIHIDLQTVGTGFVAPVYGVAVPGDTSDLFVVDQAGKIDVLHNGVMQATPMLDICPRIRRAAAGPDMMSAAFSASRLAPDLPIPPAPDFTRFTPIRAKRPARPRLISVPPPARSPAQSITRMCSSSGRSARPTRTSSTRPRGRTCSEKIIRA